MPLAPNPVARVRFPDLTGREQIPQTRPLSSAPRHAHAPPQPAISKNENLQITYEVLSVNRGKLGGVLFTDVCLC